MIEIFFMIPLLNVLTVDHVGMKSIVYMNPSFPSYSTLKIWSCLRRLPNCFDLLFFALWPCLCCLNYTGVFLSVFLLRLLWLCHNLTNLPTSIRILFSMHLILSCTVTVCLFATKTKLLIVPHTPPP